MGKLDAFLGKLAAKAALREAQRVQDGESESGLYGITLLKYHYLNINCQIYTDMYVYTYTYITKNK